MNSTVKTIVFWIVILFAATALWQVVKSGSTQNAPEISYSQFLSKVDAGDVVRVKIAKTRVNGTYRDGGSFTVVGPPNQEFMLQLLREKNVDVWYAETEGSAWAWLVNLLAPLGLLAALWYFMIRQLRKTGNVQRSGSVANLNQTGGV